MPVHMDLFLQTVPYYYLFLITLWFSSLYNQRISYVLYVVLYLYNLYPMEF